MPEKVLLCSMLWMNCIKMLKDLLVLNNWLILTNSAVYICNVTVRCVFLPSSSAQTAAETNPGAARGAGHYAT